MTCSLTVIQPASREAKSASDRRSPPGEGLPEGRIGALGQAEQHLPGAQLGLAGGELQRHQGLIADAARRDVDDPPQADLVVGVVHQAQVGDDILDLAPPVEALGPHQLVGQPGAQEGLFQQAGLGVGAVHHGEIARLRAWTATAWAMVSTT